MIYPALNREVEGAIPIFDGPPLKDLGIERLRLIEPYKAETKDREEVLHLLCGQASVLCMRNGVAWTPIKIGPRRDVFSVLPTTILLPPETSYEIVPGDSIDILVAHAPSTLDRDPVLVSPEKVRVHDIGVGTHRRTVREVLGVEGPAKRIRIGETINRRGGWSSWPSHAHPPDEEAFLVFTAPREGRAFLERSGAFVTGQAINEVIVVGNGDAVVVPRGSHSIVGTPDTKVFYVWVYLGGGKHYAKWADDQGWYQR